MQEMIIDILNQFGYIGIFLLIMIENLFPPIPSEIILTFSGFMTTHTELGVAGVILVSTAGSVAGAAVLYAVGRLLSAERLEKLFDSRLGRVLHLKRTDVVRAERWFLRRGGKAVFFCRFVPIVRSLISIPAGVAGMRFAPFLGLTFLGTLLWNTLLVILGRIAGDAWLTMAHYVDVYSMVALTVIGVGAAILGVVFIKRRFFKHTDE